MKPYFVKELENKLVMCSRDIKFGDTVQHKNGSIQKNIKIHIELAINQGWFKIIGEISPDSIVKEGDEFNKDDFYIKDECPHYNGKHMWKDCSCKIGFVNGIYIKTKH